MPYKKPILKEILAELHLASGALPPARFLAIINACAAAGFSEVEFLQVGTVTVGGDGTTTSTSTPRIRCWRPQRTACVQLSQDFVAVNYADVYPGKAAFLDLVDSVLALLAAALPGMALREVAVVVIDELKQPAGFRLGDYFLCDGALLPTILGDATTSADTTINWGPAEARRGVVLAMQPQADGGVGVMLQSFLRARAPTQPPLDVVRELVEDSAQLFRRLVTDRMKTEVMGGEL